MRVSSKQSVGYASSHDERYKLSAKERLSDAEREEGIKKKRGALENALIDQAEAEQRMENYALKAEKMRFEEQEERIREQQQRGTITDEEAQMLHTRARMHRKADEEESAFRIDEAAAAGANYVTTQQILEEVLDTEDKWLITKWLKRVSGYSWLQREAARERSKRAKLGYKHRFPRIEIFVHGKPQRIEKGMGKEENERGSLFEVVLGFVLIINGALIGIQASVSDESADGSSQVFEIMEHIFTLVFTLELILRLISDGWIWLMDRYNLADFSLIVLTGMLPMWIFGPLGIKSQEMRMMQVLRVLRLIKLVRMVRTVPMFRIFWTLIRGLLDSGRTLFWTYVMICSVLYVFAIFGVYLIGKNEDHNVEVESQEISYEFFGNVPKTLVTLFQVMTLDSWTAIARPLMEHSDYVSPYFVCFILVVCLTLGNLVTAVIINNAEASAALDNEMKAREKRDEALREIEDLRDMLMEIDVDGGGMISKDEYDEALSSNIRLLEKFQILGIGPEEQEEVFDLLDTGSGEISIDHFASGLRDMQGEAKAKDSFTLCKKAGHINTRLVNLSVRLKRQQESADELRGELNEAHRQMGGLLIELREVMEYLALCMPSEPMKRSAEDLEKLDSTLKVRREQLKSIGTIGVPQRDTTMALSTGNVRLPTKQTVVRKTVGFSAEVDAVSPEKQGAAINSTLM